MQFYRETENKDRNKERETEKQVCRAKKREILGIYLPLGTLDIQQRELECGRGRKNKRIRTIFTPEQLERMEEEFHRLV